MKSVKVWSLRIRLIHLLIALGFGFEMFSAWALANAAGESQFWIDWHLIVGQVLVFVIAARLALFFVRGPGHWRALMINSAVRRGMVEMLRYYVTLGRTPLPAWFAHNPLWRPLYLLMILLLVAGVASGISIDSGASVAGYSMYALHGIFMNILWMLVLAHVVTALLHDWTAPTGGVSGILSGYRHFPDGQEAVSTPPKPGVVEVPADVFKRSKGPGKGK